MKTLLLFLLSSSLLISNSGYAQSKDEESVRDILAEQTAAWNRGDLKGFMKGYWKDDSLKFIGMSGITYGWQKTLENYQKSYPDTAAMGKLTFDLLEVKRLSVMYFFVIGKWKLSRTVGDLSGHFTLLFRKINKRWVIVADHSS